MNPRFVDIDGNQINVRNVNYVYEMRDPSFDHVTIIVMAGGNELRLFGHEIEEVMSVLKGAG